VKRCGCVVEAIEASANEISRRLANGMSIETQRAEYIRLLASPTLEHEK
jgi:hypothetical protein